MSGQTTGNWRHGQSPRQLATPAFERALALHRDGKLDQAAEAYRHALDIDPDYAGAWCNLGVVLTAVTQDNNSEIRMT